MSLRVRECNIYIVYYCASAALSTVAAILWLYLFKYASSGTYEIDYLVEIMAIVCISWI